MTGLSSQDVDDNVTIKDPVTGDHVNVNSDNRLEVDALISGFNSSSLTNFFLEVSRGSYPQYSFVSKFGATPEVDEAEFDAVWDVPKSRYPWPTSAQTTTIVSSSANDASAGTGARTVEVQGLDSSYAFTSETATLNGTTAVTLTNSYLRVFRAKVLTAGSTGYNEGDIDIKHSTTTIARITIQLNQTLMALYTIPLNHTGYLFEWHSEVGAKVGSDSDKVGRSYLQARSFGSVFQTKDYRYHRSDGAQVSQAYKCPLVFSEKTDLIVSVTTPKNDTSFTAGFFLLLEDTTV